MVKLVPMIRSQGRSGWGKVLLRMDVDQVVYNFVDNCELLLCPNYFY